MVRVLALRRLRALRRRGVAALEQEVVRVDHVVDYAALADLLALELRLRGQVVPVVVPEVVVRRDRERLDARVDEELGEDGLELRLARLEVVASDERLEALRELDDTRDKGVLGRTVDEGLTLEEALDVMLDLIREHYDLCTAAEQRVPKTGDAKLDADVQTNIVGCRDLAIGTAYWR